MKVTGKILRQQILRLNIRNMYPKMWGFQVRLPYIACFQEFSGKLMYIAYPFPIHDPWDLQHRILVLGSPNNITHVFSETVTNLSKPVSTRHLSRS